MALTDLDPILVAAQDSQSRHPLCKILSCEATPSIPFAGQRVDSSPLNEQHPAAVIHSSGRLIVAFASGPGYPNVFYAIIYGYTDVNRTFWTYVTFPLSATGVGDVSLCELSDGTVGIVWAQTSGGTTSVQYHVIQVTGEELSPAATGTTFSQASTAYLSGPFVYCVDTDSYMLVYAAMAGSDYYIYKRTSADFRTWSSAVQLSISGLAASNRIGNPSLLKISTGQLWLFFEYVESVGPNGEELTNIYYSASDDGGSTWSPAVKVTQYTTYSEVAQHPVATQKVADQIYLVFDKVMASLHMDKNTTGWCGSESPVSNMHIDVAAQKLYIISSSMGPGLHFLDCVVKVDLATWTIDKCWSTSTVPAFPSIFAGQGMWWDSMQGGGHYVAIYTPNGVVSVLNAQTDEITTYAFYPFPAYGIAGNVAWTPSATATGMSIAKTWVDATTNRLYVAFTCTYPFNPCLQIGWIDLTAAPDPITGDYAFTTIVSEVNTISAGVLFGFSGNAGFLEIVPSADLIIVGLEGWASYLGELHVYTLSTGGLWKKYTVTSNPTFPWFGLRRGVYSAGTIAGDFTYQPLYGQGDYRGLCRIDLATDQISYSRPPWASADDYGLGDISVADAGEYLVAANGYGIALFDGTTWTLYSNASLPGLTPSGENSFSNPVVYNPTTRMIIAGHGNAYTTAWSGVIMFSRDGYLRQSQYMIGTYASGWTWGAINPLVQGFIDYEASVCVDPNDSDLYAFWTNKTGSELSIKWDKEMPAFDLSPYLAVGSAVERTSSIDPTTANWDASLSFQVAWGHLFDSSNSASLLRQYLSKGRKLTQQFGDKVSGVDYWEPVRVFTVSDDGEVTYQRPNYPLMDVKAETPRRRWEQIHMVASEYYQATPELIIADLLTNFAAIPSENISLGTWDGSAAIDYQWVDVFLSDAIDQIAYRFGYCIRDGADGVIQAVKISDAKTVDLAYGDNKAVLSVTPRNTNSSFINEWTVQCEERTFIEVLMAEEEAAELNASHRWNTGTKEYTVLYTQGNKIYRNPRLEVVQSVSALAFALAGGCDETLLDVSHTQADQSLWDTYCVIKVSSPDLTIEFEAALAALVASFFLPDISLPLGGPTIPIGKYVALAAIFICLNILAATGNFQYKVHGQPVVKVRRQLSATADDLALQAKLGQLLPDQPFQDPICGSEADCQVVANFRKMVAMGERARWACDKVTDLRNEDGDTLSVIHPMSGAAVTVFVTDLTTTFDRTSDTNGTFKQSMEGWRR